MLKPKKSNPVLICVIKDFFSFSCRRQLNPLSSRNSLSSSLFLSTISWFLPVMTMSSAYLITCTPGLIPFIRGFASFICFSIPFSAILHNVGEMIPPPPSIHGERSSLFCCHTVELFHHSRFKPLF